jgi:hypothetical protein
VAATVVEPKEMCAWLETGLHGGICRLKMYVEGFFRFGLQAGCTEERMKSQQEHDSCESKFVSHDCYPSSGRGEAPQFVAAAAPGLSRSSATARNRSS